MRGRRSKVYRKLMQQIGIHFGHREPYQVLVDADIVCDAARFTMDLVPALERTLHGKVKPMITQCSMRHLYSRGKEPGMEKVIAQAKTFERRRCGHKPEDYEEPLAAEECVLHCVGSQNKHCYVVATQDQGLRRELRQVPGCPLIYVSRSVMILEPMSQVTVEACQKEEGRKFRSELRNPTAKRKREPEDEGNEPSETAKSEPGCSKKWTPGPKGPNPLSVKRKKTVGQSSGPAPSKTDAHKPMHR